MYQEDMSVRMHLFWVHFSHPMISVVFLGIFVDIVVFLFLFCC